MPFSIKKPDTQFIFENVPIAGSNGEKLFRVKIDQTLSSEPHVEFLCQKASQKLNVLSWMASSLKFD